MLYIFIIIIEAFHFGNYAGRLSLIDWRYVDVP